MCNNGIVKCRDLELILILISPRSLWFKAHMLKSQGGWFVETSFNLEVASDLLFICSLLFFFRAKIFHKTSYNFSGFSGTNHLRSFCRVSLGHGKVLSFSAQHIYESCSSQLLFSNGSFHVSLRNLDEVPKPKLLPIYNCEKILECSCI